VERRSGFQQFRLVEVRLCALRQDGALQRRRISAISAR